MRWSNLSNANNALSSTRSRLQNVYANRNNYTKEIKNPIRCCFFNVYPPTLRVFDEGSHVAAVAEAQSEDTLWQEKANVAEKCLNKCRAAVGLRQL